MLYIFTALRAEAEPFIRKFGLKKRPEESSFQIYGDADRDMLLTVTGTGPVRAAAAVGSALGRLTGEARREAALLNFGSCADITNRSFAGSDGKRDGEACPCGAEEANEKSEWIGNQNTAGNKDNASPFLLYRINCLQNADSGRVWYPDLLLKSSLPETVLISGSRVLHRDEERAESPGEGAVYPVLYDMEGAAIYEAGNLFLGPHQMHFLKCVTDQGDAAAVTREALARCVEDVSGGLLAYTEDLLQNRYISVRKNAVLQKYVPGRAGTRDNAEMSSGNSKTPDSAEMLLGNAETRVGKGGDGRTANTRERPAASPALAGGLCASAAMEAKLAGLLHYADCAGISWQGYFQKLKAAGRFPAPDRRRGKEILRDFENYVSGTRSE